MLKFLKKIINIVIKFFTTPWFFYDPRPQIANERWRIHKLDVDKNFPSIPHMDCVTDSRKKMNIYTGEIYFKNNKKCIDKANKKELEILWKEWSFRKIVYDERIRYYELYKKEVKESVPEIYKEEYKKYVDKSK